MVQSSNSILYKYIKRKNNCYKYKDKQRQKKSNVQQYAFKVHSSYGKYIAIQNDK